MSEPKTQFDNLIAAEEKKKTNSFNRARNNTVSSKNTSQESIPETKVENESEYEPQRPTMNPEPQEKVVKSESKKKKVTEEESNSDNAILNELFPKGAKEKNFNAHSLYLSDSQWKKIQKIAKEQNISCSAVVSKILDKVL